MPLTLDTISRHFAHNRALISVSTVINDGDVAAVFGANGAGKTTLLKVIAGAIPAASGRVWIDELRIKPNRPIARRQVFLSGGSRHRDERVYDPILRTIELYQVRREDVAAEAAEYTRRFNLIKAFPKSMGALSRGERSKIELIGLFLARPKVWLLDEPYSVGLDANGLSVLHEEIKRHTANKGIVIFTSQWPREASFIARRALVLSEGRLIWDHELTKRPNAAALESLPTETRTILQELRTYDQR